MPTLTEKSPVIGDPVYSFATWLKTIGEGDFDRYAERFCEVNHLTNYHREFDWPEERKLFVGLYVVSSTFGIYAGNRSFKVQGTRQMRDHLEEFGYDKDLIICTNSHSPSLKGYERRDPQYLWSGSCAWPLEIQDCCKKAGLPPPRNVTDVEHMAEVYLNLVKKYDELKVKS